MAAGQPVSPDLDAAPSPAGTEPTTLEEVKIGLRPAVGIEERRESARGLVAACLLGILALLSLAPFVALWFAWATVPELVSLLQIIFGPVVTLVGAVAGFYFGAASTAQSPGGSTNQPK